MDIEKTTNVLNGVEVLAKTAAQVMKDGKIGVNDLFALVTLLRDFDKLHDAVMSIKDISPELSDLNDEELIFLGKKLVEIAKNVAKTLQ